MQFTRAALVSVFLAAAAPAAAAELKYTIPEELFNLFGYGQGQTDSSSSSHAAAAVDAADASCTYPAQFNVTSFVATTPAFNTTATYVSFHYANADTGIDTDCAYNASSVSLTANTTLAARYACNDPLVSFIWTNGALAASNSSSSNATAVLGRRATSGKLTAIETACAGQTTRKFEATGSIAVSGLRCSRMRSAGTVCTSDGWLNNDFTSLQPSPLN